MSHFDDSTPSSSRWHGLISAGLVLLALVLRLYHLDHQELWFDESHSFHSASFPDWLAVLRLDPNPPLYYAVLRGWFPVAGPSEMAMRLPSAICGTLFVAATLWVGRILFNSRVAMWSAAFAAVAPMHIYYSQEARSYALLMLIVVLTYGFLWRAMERNTWGAWAAVLGCELAALFTHYFAGIALLPTVFLLFLWPERKGRKTRWVRYSLTASASAALVLPWILTSIASGGLHAHTIAWTAANWENVTPALTVPKTLEILAFGAHQEFLDFYLKQMNGIPLPASLRAVGLLSLAVLGAVLIFPWGDRGLGVPWPGRRKLWLLSLFFLPLAVLWLVSFFEITAVYVVGRYDMIVFPAFALLVGMALTKLQNSSRMGRYGAAVLFLALLSVQSFKLFHYYRAPSEDFARSTARLLDRHSKNGDVVILTGGATALPVLYYLYLLGYTEEYCHNNASGRNLVCRMFPDHEERKYFGRGRVSYEAIQPSHFLAPPVDEILDDSLRSLASPENRVWIVFWSIAALRKARAMEDGGQVLMDRADVQLLEALKDRGFVARQLLDAPWILAFNRGRQANSRSETEREESQNR